MSTKGSVKAMKAHTSKHNISFKKRFFRHSTTRVSNSAIKRASSPRSRPQSGVVVRCLAVSPEAVFNIATLAVMPFFGMMVASPRAQLTQNIMRSRWTYYIAAALYLALLALWNPLPRLWAAFCASALTGGLPSLPAFAALFSVPENTSFVWLHLVVLDLFQAR